MTFLKRPVHAFCMNALHATGVLPGPWKFNLFSGLRRVFSVPTQPLETSGDYFSEIVV
jgi:hypothetical protein